MEPPTLFPVEPLPIPAAIPRWLRLVVTLDHEGKPAHVEVEAISVMAETLASRGYWRSGSNQGQPEPLRYLLSVAWSLVND